MGGAQSAIILYLLYCIWNLKIFDKIWNLKIHVNSVWPALWMPISVMVQDICISSSECANYCHALLLVLNAALQKGGFGPLFDCGTPVKRTPLQSQNKAIWKCNDKRLDIHECSMIWLAIPQSQIGSGHSANSQKFIKLACMKLASTWCRCYELLNSCTFLNALP